MKAEESWQIKRMEDTHLVRVTELADQLGYPTKLEDMRNRWSVVRQNGEAELLVILDSADQVLGWVQVNVEAPSLLANRRAEIAALVVDEKFRGRGLGRMLIGAAQDWAKAKGANLIRLRSNMKRENAHKFYQREGYTIAKSWHCFVKEI